MATVNAINDTFYVGSEKWEPEFDNGTAWRARLGFVLISNDTIIEEDMFRLAPEGVGVHFTRARMPTGCTVENLASMEACLADAAAELLPEFDVDVVCYGCTSGSVVIGEDNVVRELQRGNPTRQATTLLTGVIEGLRALSASHSSLRWPTSPAPTWRRRWIRPVQPYKGATGSWRRRPDSNR